MRLDQRQAGADFKPTASMIEAGALVASDFREIADDAELALRIYTAMLEASAVECVPSRANG